MRITTDPKRDLRFEFEYSTLIIWSFRIRISIFGTKELYNPGVPPFFLLSPHPRRDGEILTEVHKRPIKKPYSLDQSCSKQNIHWTLCVRRCVQESYIHTCLTQVTVPGLSFSLFLGSQRPNLITGLSGWQAPD